MPRDTWAEWSTSSSSNIFGWIVQVVGRRSDANDTTVLMVRSLHRDEFHCQGDINVTSLGKDISMQRIAGLKRDALMMSLSGAELGTLTEGEGSFRPCQALQNYDSAGSSARVKQIVMPAPDPIRREPRAPFIIVQADQVQGALKSQLQRHGSCLHRLDKGAKVSLRKGWWQTGERTKIKAQQPHEIWVSTSLETGRSTFQASDIESNLRWTPD